jgi:hypothetical protein
MKDAFERRALLLHLGTVLEAINEVLALAGSRNTPVRELAAEHRSLAKLPLLQQMHAALTAQEFAQRTSAAFAAWPAQLLEAELDRKHLALVVRDKLFSANEAGWSAYVASLKPEVSWFGEDLPAMRTEPVLDAALRRKAAEPVRAKEAQHKEALAAAGVYPSWPWKSQA